MRMDLQLRTRFALHVGSQPETRQLGAITSMTNTFKTLAIAALGGTDPPRLRSSTRHL